jgi:hypothetical protein
MSLCYLLSYLYCHALCHNAEGTAGVNNGTLNSVNALMTSHNAEGIAWFYYPMVPLWDSMSRTGLG